MAVQAGNGKLFPIGAVSELTGVNSVTLRAWERRYGLITPERTPSGHRLYSDSDIRLIEQVLEQLGRGLTISSVARQLHAVEMSTEDEAAGDAWHEYRHSMIEAISRFDESVLDGIYNEAMSLYPVDIVTSRLVVPLLQELGERWSAGLEGGIAEEHFFSVFMRNKLGARFHHRNANNNGPVIAAACLPGEYHEFGLLLFALSAHARGYRLILLGADMPLHELPLVIARTRVDGIVLSGSINAHCMEVAMQVTGLTQTVEVPVFIGGEVAGKCREVIEDTGGIPVGPDLVSGIQVIRRTLPPRKGGNSTREEI
jgi:DNA-binding transcriptional MerR regulator